MTGPAVAPCSCWSWPSTNDPGHVSVTTYNHDLDEVPTMEAERLNSLVNLVDDLHRRLVELRGYL
jgi:hypothetical protein